MKELLPLARVINSAIADLRSRGNDAAFVDAGHKVMRDDGGPFVRVAVLLSDGHIVSVDTRDRFILRLVAPAAELH